MRASRLTVALLLALALGALPIESASARAQGTGDSVEAASATPGSGGGWLGSLSAVACGLSGRALGAGFVHAGVIAGALASCGLMIFVAFVLDEH